MLNKARLLMVSAVVLLVALDVAGIMPVTRAISPNSNIEAVLLPAPVGYSYTFSGYNIEIAGFQDSQNNFYYYRANLNSGDFVYIGSSPIVSTLISSVSNMRLKFIVPEPMAVLYTVELPASEKAYIIYSGGQVYGSEYYIYYGFLPANLSGFPRLVQMGLAPILDIVANGIVFPVMQDTKTLLVITHSDMDINVYVNGKTPLQISESLPEFLGLPQACFSWFSKPVTYDGVQWLGGLVESPACMSANITPIMNVTYQGETYFVVLSANTRFGHIDYIAFAPPFTNLLSALGFIDNLNLNQAYHIYPYNGEYNFLYLQMPNSTFPVMGEVITANDISNLESNGNATCIIPQGSNVIYELLWKYRQLTGQVSLMPGEVVIFNYSNKTYFCHGALDWLESGYANIQTPAFQQITFPIQVSSYSPVLAVESDGKVFYGTKFSIPWNDYKQNEIFVISRAGIVLVVARQHSIFFSYAFILGISIVGVLAGLIIFNRPEKPEDFITVIDDLPEVTPLETSPEERVREEVAKHVSQFGVCPDIVDLAIYHDILPPIDPSAKGDVILCPWRTNVKSELVLREIGKILNEGLFVISREKNYIYTIIGESRLLLYFYKQEFETKPEEIIKNAVLSVYRATKGLDNIYFNRELGLVIFTTPEMRPLVEKEVEKLEKLKGIPTEHTAGGKERRQETPQPSYNLREYFSMVNVSINLSAEALKAIAEHIGNILVISTDNVTELISFLSERVVSYTELSMRGRRHEGY